jgi:hypothetical protein
MGAPKHQLAIGGAEGSDLMRTVLKLAAEATFISNAVFVGRVA